MMSSSEYAGGGSRQSNWLQTIFVTLRGGVIVLSTRDIGSIAVKELKIRRTFHVFKGGDIPVFLAQTGRIQDCCRRQVAWHAERNPFGKARCPKLEKARLVTAEAPFRVPLRQPIHDLA